MAASGSGPAGLQAALRLLRRMMDGERLRASDVVGEDGQLAAQRRRLDTLVEHVPGVVTDERRQGVAGEYRFEWPADQTARPEQVWALAAARTMLDALRDAEIGLVLADLLENHAARLSGGRASRDELDRMFFTGGRHFTPRGLDADTLDLISKAIFERRLVTFGYRHFDGRASELEVEPWTLVFSNEGPYLYGRVVDGTRDDLVKMRRLLNVARVQRLRISRRSFLYPLRADHDPATVFRHCFDLMVPADGDAEPARVVLRFDRSMAAYVDMHELHATQETPVPLADGGREVTMHVFVTYDLVRWVRGHGRTVAVLRPDNLRAWVADGSGGEAYKRYVLDEIGEG